MSTHNLRGGNRWLDAEMGTIIAWGSNRSGQVNVPAGLTCVIAGAAEFADYRLALCGFAMTHLASHKRWRVDWRGSATGQGKTFPTPGVASRLR
jgi:hypothetical protein